MGKPIPWPETTWLPYQELTSRLPKLEAVILTCQEGSQERNKELLRRLLRMVYDRSRRIEDSCIEIAKLLPKVRTGREPKWYQITLDIKALILDIISLTEEINHSLRSNEFIYIDTLLKCMKGKVDRIKRLLEEHPHMGPEKLPDLTVWEKTVSEALSDFD